MTRRMEKYIDEIYESERESFSQWLLEYLIQQDSNEDKLLILKYVEDNNYYL